MVESKDTKGVLQLVATELGPKAIGPYSQAQIAPGGLKTVYVSGNIGVDPKTSKMVSGGIEEQATQALTNIGNVLKAAGTTPANVTKCTVYLTVDFPLISS